ncbi:MAG: MFS transporter [Verrucomicrobiota bacterium]
MQSHKTRTLWLVGMLHGFTHVYQVALLPLYFLIREDFRLASVGEATLLVTVMMAAYFIPSYPMGILADRFSRKRLLGVGLLINAVGFIALALAPNYGFALFGVALAGFGGSFFHPAATSLIAGLFPTNTGRALGYIGMGASVGFFIGPLYAGWRAAEAGSWRAPVLELGLLGLLGAALFIWLGEEKPKGESPASTLRHPAAMFPTPVLWALFIGMSLAMSLRDFAGSSMGSLGSLFLQQAHGFKPDQTGLTLSSIFLAATISNPLFGHLSDRGRIRWTTFVLIMASLLVALFPHVPRSGLIPAFAIYGFFFMASYPMVEAALMEAVPDAVRGRVFGLFITVGGLIGNVSHWIVGDWVQRLGEAGKTPEGYFGLYRLLAAFILLSMLGLLCLKAIRKREQHIEAERSHTLPGGPVTSPTAVRNPHAE